MNEFWKKSKNILLIMFSFLAFVGLIWPTPYEYIHKTPDVYRVNRFTGVRQQATAKGWKTDDEIAQERKELTDKKAREAKNREDQVRWLLNQVQCDTARREGDFYTVIVHNPTEWDLFCGQNNVLVEYTWYNPKTQQEEWLCSNKESASFIYARQRQSIFVVSPSSNPMPSEIRQLPPGTTFTQKVTMEYRMATSTQGNQIETINFQPPIHITVSRAFITPK